MSDPKRTIAALRAAEPEQWCAAVAAYASDGQVFGETEQLVAALLARAAAERAEADRLDAAADPIRAAVHYHCARVLEEVACQAGTRD